MDPSPKYRISTITATGSVNTEINLDLFYDALNICADDADEGVVYVEYGKKKSDTVYKGFSKKFLVNKRKVPSTTKRFDNQVTIVYRRNESVDGVSFLSALNIKVFKNGNVQITGIKYIQQGSKMIDTIIGILKSVYDYNPAIIKSPEIMINRNYNICLINSDFRIGFAIKRDLLYKTFTGKYCNDCSFEPCIYPGVKLQYFYNTINGHKDGTCHCDKPCLVGKGNGREDGSCKKITIAVFQSGCVIITGAQSHDQINESHEFITSVLNDNRNEIEKKQIITIEPQLPKKIIMINKKNIVYGMQQVNL
jgi:TATA-box binding protein (TBP) (component of TFIID and TFIIIB)